MNGTEGLTPTDWAIIAAFFATLIPVTLHWSRIKTALMRAREIRDKHERELP